MCREEVRLNRRLAPEIYLGVVGIVRRGNRFSPTSEDGPAAIEYAVEMRRVQEDRSLAALVRRGELEPPHIKAVASRLARFHAEAPTAPAELRDVRILEDTLEENLATLRGSGTGILDTERLDAAERFTHSFLAARRAGLDARARAGLVRDWHGDLRAEHVIVPEQGPVYVYDCVEFNPTLRQIDIAADIAFLIMDLTWLGAEEAAIRLTDDYRRAGGDPGDDVLLYFFASYRAWVRAKVACLRASGAGPQRRPAPWQGGRRTRAARSRAPVRLARPRSARPGGLGRGGQRQDDARPPSGRVQRLAAHLVGRNPKAARGPYADRARERGHLLARVDDPDLRGDGPARPQGARSQPRCDR